MLLLVLFRFWLLRFFAIICVISHLTFAFFAFIRVISHFTFASCRIWLLRVIFFPLFAFDFFVFSPLTFAGFFSPSFALFRIWLSLFLPLFAFFAFDFGGVFLAFILVISHLTFSFFRLWLSRGFFRLYSNYFLLDFRVFSPLFAFFRLWFSRFSPWFAFFAFIRIWFSRF